MALSAYVAQSAHVALSADGALSAPPTGANHWHFTECHRLRVARGCFTPTKVRSAKHPHTTQALPTRTSRLVWGHVCIPKGIIIKKVKFPDYLILRKVSQGNGALGRRIYGRVIEYTDKAKHGTKALMCRILVYYSVISYSIGSAIFPQSLLILLSLWLRRFVKYSEGRCSEKWSYTLGIYQTIRKCHRKATDKSLSSRKSCNPLRRAKYILRIRSLLRSMVSHSEDW